MPYVAVPNSGQTLGQTRDQLRNNIQDLKDSLAVNHYDLDTASEGKHKYVQMPVQGTIPAGLVVGDGTLYTKVDGNAIPQMFYTNGSSGNEYQLTNASNANFATFSTNTNYSGTLNGGWTFLPGGMLLQYGQTGASAGTSTDVTFPKNFNALTTPFSIQLTPLRLSGSPGAAFGFWVSTTAGTIDNTKFRIINNSGHSFAWYWMAIGIA